MLILSNQLVMPHMRHIAAHGVYSPSKASQWGLQRFIDNALDTLKSFLLLNE